MGGLKKDLPITYWTFLIGAIAIAGVPGLAGFFSKDEILCADSSSGHTILWVVGVLTALLTATYMFRLVFLAFHGAPRYAPAAGHAHEPGTGLVTGTGDARSPVRSPARRAAGDGDRAHRAGDRLGRRRLRRRAAALGGSNEIEHYLEPSFEARTRSEARPRGSEASRPPRARERPLAARRRRPSSREGRSERAAGAEHSEAHGVFADGRLHRRRLHRHRNRVVLLRAATRRGRRRRRVGRSVYQPAAPQVLRRRALRRGRSCSPIVSFSRGVLWKVVDVEVIDGAVNGAGSSWRRAPACCDGSRPARCACMPRRLMLGVVLVLGYYVWRFAQGATF